MKEAKTRGRWDRCIAEIFVGCACSPWRRRPLPKRIAFPFVVSLDDRSARGLHGKRIRVIAIRMVSAGQEEPITPKTGRRLDSYEIGLSVWGL
jgi:hypothetical protein